jgi:hypothetical protein
MPAFTPPTVKQPLGTGPLLSRFNMDVGQGVVKKSGVFTITPWPWLGELQAAGDEGTDWFLGGRTYQITDTTATALEADGFTTDRTVGYGEGEYGDGDYGQ